MGKFTIFFLSIYHHSTMFQVHFIEACHTLGLSLLVFRVLPSIDNVTGLFILNGVCIVPAILNLFSSRRSHNQLMKNLIFCTDICSVLMQLSVFFIPYLLPSKDKSSSSFQWELPLALFLISLGYWESFTETRMAKQKFFKWFQHGIRALRKTRPKVYITASLLKLFILITSAIYFLPKSIDKNLYFHAFDRIPLGINRITIPRVLGGGVFDEHEDLFRITYEVYIPFLVQIISSCVCYYTGRIACKVRQKIDLPE